MFAPRPRILLFVVGLCVLLLTASNNLRSGDSVAAQSTAVPSITSISGSIDSSNPDMLNVSLQGNDPDGDVIQFSLRLLDARSTAAFSVDRVAFNPPPSSPGNFTANITFTGLRGFLGTCTCEITVIDRAGNRSTARSFNYRSCTLPIIDGATALPINGDQIRVDIRAGDPDGNTNSVTFEIRDAGGAILRSGSLAFSSPLPSGQTRVIQVPINGISLLNNPRVVRVQLVDAQGNRSSPADAPFTPIVGRPDLQIMSLMVNPSVTSGGATVRVDTSISNRGDAPAGSSSAEIRFSQDNVIDSNDTLLATLAVSALNPGQQADLSMMVVIPPSPQGGSFFVGVIADSGRQVSESSETNNTQSRPITLSTTSDTVAPIVSITAPRAGDTVMLGEALQIRFTSSDNVGVVANDIDLSTDGGATFKTIAQNLAGNVQQFAFTVPPDFIPPTRQAVVRVTSRDASGNTGMASSERFNLGDFVSPTVKLMPLAGGGTLMSGSQVTIQFTVTDNDAPAGAVIDLSTDGGQTFPEQNRIGQAGPTDTSIFWNIPDTLQAAQAQIQVTARDRSGNTATAKSEKFVIQRPQSTVPLLQVRVSFEPPQPGQIAPPVNVRADASEVRATPTLNALVVAGGEINNFNFPADQAAAPQLIGYNIYRVIQPPPDQMQPTAMEIVGDPRNLVGSVPASSTTFTDTVSTSKGNNFVYSITSFYGTGVASSGSQPAGTNLPVIRNPVDFRSGTVFLILSGSFIKDGAMLIVEDREMYPLILDNSGAFFTVPKKTPGVPGGLILKKLIKKGASARLVVKNLDGKSSVGFIFTRPR